MLELREEERDMSARGVQSSVETDTTRARCGRAVAEPAAVRQDLSRVLSGAPPRGFVRADVLSSWRDSIASGLVPDRCAHEHSDFDVGSDLLRAAEPVIDRLAADLSDAETSVVLSDSEIRVVARRSHDDEQRRHLDSLAFAPGYVWRVDVAGTNALALASERRTPIIVDGPEHFMEALTAVTTASAPIRDLRSDRIVGAVTLICPVALTNAFLLPLAHGAATEIEQRLLDGHSARDRLLEEHFLRARRRARAPIAVVSERTLLINARASGLIERADRPRLWAVVKEAIALHNSTTAPFTSARGPTVVASVEPIHDGKELIGALLRLRMASDDGTPAAPSESTRSPRERPAFGWASLTDTERSLANLVAEGFTNKEAAARLFVSHHTVDAHLRHIFAKLGLNSRVELARVVAARPEEDPEALRAVS
jgi:DNA-binding CsgD family transcriptional regulator